MRGHQEYQDSAEYRPTWRSLATSFADKQAFRPNHHADGVAELAAEDAEKKQPTLPGMAPLLDTKSERVRLIAASMPWKL